MKRIFVIAITSLVLAATGGAHAAELWGLPGERKARFEAKVVDVLCELTGDCPAACGAGKRQLGLLTDAGRLILPLKNVVPFAGAADELIDFCASQVIADGLFSTNRGHTVFVLQFVRQAPNGTWRRANRFTPRWAKRNGLKPGDEKASRWFENDSRVKALIDSHGKLGLGPAADRAYFASQK